MSSDDCTGRQADLLGDLRVLRQRARTARHAYWFPLILFGLLIGASAPFYLQLYLPPSPAAAAGPGPQLPVLGGEFSGSAAQHFLGYYWLAALLGGLLLTLLWSRRHARRIGLQTPARGYVIPVAVLTALALIIPLLPGHLRVLWPGDLVVRGTFPFVIIAAGLWALAWAERSRALVVIAAVYTGAALLASLYNVENLLFRLGWRPGPGDWDLTSLPNVLLPAIVLLAAGAGAFAVQRRNRVAA